ncbi:MAG: hypothetical protein ABI886_15865, partial [Betaproteobacteria bacterium]
GAALVAGRALIAPALAPLTAILGAAILLLFAMFGFADLRTALADTTPVNRLLLQVAPLTVVFTVLAFVAFSTRAAAPAPAAG